MFAHLELADKTTQDEVKIEINQEPSSSSSSEEEDATPNIQKQITRRSSTYTKTSKFAPS